MLENVVTPVPAKAAPEASLRRPLSLVEDTSVRIQPLTVAPEERPSRSPRSPAGAATAAMAATTATMMSRLM